MHTRCPGPHCGLSHCSLPRCSSSRIHVTVKDKRTRHVASRLLPSFIDNICICNQQSPFNIFNAPPEFASPPFPHATIRSLRIFAPNARKCQTMILGIGRQMILSESSVSPGKSTVHWDALNHTQTQRTLSSSFECIGSPAAFFSRP